MGAERLFSPGFKAPGPIAALAEPALGGIPAGSGVADALGLSRLGAYRRLLGLAKKRESGETGSARVVCVASGKGGTGKSIIASNLAVLRAKRGERVLLVDFDAGLANAHLLLGLAPQYDLSHVLQGQVKADPQDPKGPLTVGAVVTRDKARIVVYGTANLATNQFLNLQGNRDFFLNTVSWLAEEEDQISIRPKDTKQTPVFLSAQQGQAVFLLPVVVMPALVLIGGIVAVVRRRASK